MYGMSRLRRTAAIASLPQTTSPWSERMGASWTIVVLCCMLILALLLAAVDSIRRRTRRFDHTCPLGEFVCQVPSKSFTRAADGYAPAFGHALLHIGRLHDLHDLRIE